MTLYKHNVLDEIACILPVDDRTRPVLRAKAVEEPNVVPVQGVSRVGQRILEVLTTEPTSPRDLHSAMRARGYPYHLQSVTRALHVLALANLVERTGWKRWRRLP